MRHETIQIHTRHARPAELTYFPARGISDESVLVAFRDARGRIRHFDHHETERDQSRSEVSVDAEGEADLYLSIPQLRRIVDEGSRILAERDAESLLDEVAS